MPAVSPIGLGMDSDARVALRLAAGFGTDTVAGAMPCIALVMGFVTLRLAAALRLAAVLGMVVGMVVFRGLVMRVGPELAPPPTEMVGPAGRVGAVPCAAAEVVSRVGIETDRTPAEDWLVGATTTGLAGSEPAPLVGEVRPAINCGRNVKGADKALVGVVPVLSVTLAAALPLGVVPFMGDGG